MKNHTPKSELKVDGKMSEQGADKVGNKLANAAIIFVVLIGFAALIAACRWWQPIHQFTTPPTWRFFYA